MHLRLSHYYCKFVMVGSRVNLYNNWCIFWLSKTTKALLGFALYTQRISFWTYAFQEFTNEIETDEDAFETITIPSFFTNICYLSSSTSCLFVLTLCPTGNMTSLSLLCLFLIPRRAFSLSLSLSLTLSLLLLLFQLSPSLSTSLI